AAAGTPGGAPSPSEVAMAMPIASAPPAMAPIKNGRGIRRELGAPPAPATGRPRATIAVASAAGATCAAGGATAARSPEARSSTASARASSVAVGRSSGATDSARSIAAAIEGGSSTRRSPIGVGRRVAVGGAERRLAGQPGVEGGGQRVDVGGRADRAALERLRRGEGGSAEELAGDGQLGVGGVRDAEIGQLPGARLRLQDVRRLHV